VRPGLPYTTEYAPDKRNYRASLRSESSLSEGNSLISFRSYSSSLGRKGVAATMPTRTVDSKGNYNFKQKNRNKQTEDLLRRALPGESNGLPELFWLRRLAH
jgi:hypothetical protein